MSANASSPAPRDFFPRGAIAFFVALIVGYAALWLGVYALMMTRAVH
jgi:hypothetical protein